MFDSIGILSLVVAGALILSLVTVFVDIWKRAHLVLILRILLLAISIICTVIVGAGRGLDGIFIACAIMTGLNVLWFVATVRKITKHDLLARQR